MLLNLKDISFGFSPEKQIFKNLSFGLKQGKIYALMGGNGSGKTTLLNLISGFHKPSGGNIVFRQQDISRSAPHKTNRIGIGRTFQDLRLITKLTVKENILLAMQFNPTDNWLKAFLPASLFKSERRNLESKTEVILTNYFLQEVQDSPANEISFGQQKLLNLACCTANGAELLLLDEPVAGISPQYQQQITQLIQSLQQQGKTILMIEHNAAFIETTGEHFLFLDGGVLSEFETFQQLQSDRLATDGYF